MKELTIELSYTPELWELMNGKMDEFGQITLGEGVVADVLPIDEKNFINEVEPVITVILNGVTEVAVGLLINWLYDCIKNSGKISVSGHILKFKNKEELIQLVDNEANEKDEIP